MSEVATQDRADLIVAVAPSPDAAMIAEADGPTASLEASTLDRAVFGQGRESFQRIREERDRAQVLTRLAERRIAELEAHVAAAQDQLRVGAAQVQAELASTRAELRQQSDQARTLERKGAELQARLATAHQEISARTEQARQADATVSELRADLEATRDQLRESGAAIQAELLVTREELAESTDRARRAEARVAELQAEDRARVDPWTVPERAGGWSEELGPVVGSVHAAIGCTQARIDEVSHRICDALAPMTWAIGRLGDSLDRLAGAAGADAGWPGQVDPRTAAHRRGDPGRQPG